MSRGPSRVVPLIRPDLPSLAEIAPALEQSLASGRITNFGPNVTEFERAAGEYVGAHAVTTSSGTMGLLFTLQALGLPKGGKVILPSFTFMATAQAVVYAGGIPVYAEIRDDLTLDPDDLEQLLRQHPDTAAVIPVHMYGLPCDTDAIEQVAASATGREPVHVIYDAAHAFGSAAGGRKVGAFGKAEVFSLSVTKVLVSVEGGMVTSHDSVLIERLRHMRNYGIESNYNAWYPGLNGKMSELHAIVGLANLKRLDERMIVRRQLAEKYAARVHEQTSFRVLPWPENVRHTFKDFTVWVPEELVARRDGLIEWLKQCGVETRAYFYPPVHEQELFKRYTDRPLPRTERLARRVLTLPFFTTMTDDDIDHVAECLRRAEQQLS